MTETEVLRAEIAEANKTIQNRLNININLAQQIKNNLALNKVDEKINALRDNALKLLEGLENAGK